ncbi:hypothetical protein LOCUS_45320 [Klebsiella pneumoniae]|nr:hypothetical protein LOCUS_35170 [Klebsiella pneumoniae]GMW39656.1 hypothetical protein LOCUS_54200 [Klebsiella pneumoniae]GMW50204.1 hypothetical protein LOCUS_51980 [Klebsiella pneumoniae]GMW70679.1 hypothetical protein LOCUS_47460 [Klebsiella pneumoniae]GMW81377.1 hypothetical protein LOCUS_45320 [Klebsiella pneumoniae]
MMCEVFCKVRGLFFEEMLKRSTYDICLSKIIDMQGWQRFAVFSNRREEKQGELEEASAAASQS